MTNTSRLISRLVILLRAAVGALMVSAVLLNFANVIGRYVFMHPFIWAEEVMQIFNVWAVLLGAAVVTRDNTHIRMDFFYNLVPRRSRRALEALFALLTCVIGVYVILQSAQMIGMLASTGQRSVIARLPMAVMYLAVPLGYLFTISFLLLWAVGRGGELHPQSDSPGEPGISPAGTALDGEHDRERSGA